MKQHEKEVNANREFSICRQIEMKHQLGSMTYKETKNPRTSTQSVKQSSLLGKYFVRFYFAVLHLSDFCMAFRQGPC